MRGARPVKKLALKREATGPPKSRISSRLSCFAAHAMTMQNPFGQTGASVLSKASAYSRLAGLPEKSYKRECQETYFTVGSVPILFCFGIQPNRMNVHS